MRAVICKLLFLLSVCLFSGAGVGVASAADKPYDEHADAQQVLHDAYARARVEHKRVMVVFGANWCPDCRLMDTILHGPSASDLGQRFVMVKVDVGGFDKNLSLARHFDIPLAKGIPAIAMVDADESVRFVTRAGELAEAKSMGDAAVVRFLSDAAASLGSQP
jgi:protein disulfide-isomerase